MSRTTTNLGLYVPAQGEHYGTHMDDNLDILDNLGSATSDQGRTTLGTAIVPGATSFRAASSLAVSVGMYLAVGVGTSKCEVRRVTSIASAPTYAVATVGDENSPGGAYRYAHSVGEKVWIAPNPVPLEWFGCVGNNSATDSFNGIQQALWETTDAQFGLIGTSLVWYYTSRTLCFPEKVALQYFRTQAKVPFGIDCMIGKDLAGLPDQWHGFLAGQFHWVASFDGTANRIDFGVENPGGVGQDPVHFYPLEGATLPTGLEVGRRYYTKTNYGGNVWSISTDQGGSELDFTGNGSAPAATTGTGIRWGSTGGARLRGFDWEFEGTAAIQALNGFQSCTIQPSYLYNGRFQNYAGPQGAFAWCAQQGDFFGLEVLASRVGIRIGGDSSWFYSYGLNPEGNETGILLADYALLDATIQGSQKNCTFFNGHFENSTGYIQRCQRILGNANVTGGTYTLTFRGQTTAAIAYNASAATVQLKLEALSNIAGDGVTPSGVDISVTSHGAGLPGSAPAYPYTSSSSAELRINFLDSSPTYGYTFLPSVTVNTGSLTGGAYTMFYGHPNRRQASGFNGRGIMFNNWLANDNQGADFFTRDVSSFNNSWTGLGLQLINITSLGSAAPIVGGGTQAEIDVDSCAYRDLVRGFSIPWGSVDGGANEFLAYFQTPYASRINSGLSSNSWMLMGGLDPNVSGGTGTKTISFEDLQAEMRFYNGSSIRMLDAAGPTITAGSAAPSASEPNGSLYLRKGTGVYKRQAGAWTQL